LTMRLIRYDFRLRADSEDLETHLIRVGQLFGFHNWVYILLDRMPARTVHDYQNIIARLRGIPVYVDQNIGIMNEAIAEKMTQPRVVADLVTKQIETQMRQDANQTALLEPFRRFPSNISRPEEQKLLAEATGAYEKQYAESLGAQLGLYRDPYHRFGQLSSERFRAVRLVVDTGIHEMGWTREQAVDYFKQHAPEASLAEIDRYISWPAQALSYKMGQLRIRMLRQEAQKRLGAKFDIRDFHNAVLRDGTLPLELLSDQVHGWMAH
jgi:uncharacterized protein (DUF885 family)